jgi:hypothetical protein
MATLGFITRVKTHLNITHNLFDAKLGDLIDEALVLVNRFKETAITETTADALDRRAIYLYVAIRLDDRDAELGEAWKQQLELIRER